MNSFDGDHHHDALMGQTSPLRRSVRRSAAAASEKIKHGDDIMVNGHAAADYQDYNNDSQLVDHRANDGDAALLNGSVDKPKPASNPKKLVRYRFLDQFDANFAIKLNDYNEVEMMSEDESDTSMHEEDKTKLKKALEFAQKSEPTPIQRHTRKRMISEMKATLRQEEAALILLKKLKHNQTPQASSQYSHTNKQPASNIRPGQSFNSSVHNRSLEEQRRAQQITEQQRRLTEVMKQQSYNHKPTPPAAHTGKPNNTSFNSTTQPQPAHQSNRSLEPAQRQMQAKMVLRKQLERNLLSLKAPPPPKTDLNFVPNPNQLDFILLHGLDLVVHKVLKNKSHTKIQVQPWSCFQCGTDFTHTWHYVRDNVDNDNDTSQNLKPQCEQCYRSGWKKANRQAHTGAIKKEFLAALTREQEIDKMKDGKIDWNKLGLQPPSNWDAVNSSNSKPSSSSSANLTNGIPSSASPGINAARLPHNHSASAVRTSQNYHGTSMASSGSNASMHQAAASALRQASNQQPANAMMMAAMQALAQQSAPQQIFMNQLAAMWNQQQAQSLNNASRTNSAQQQMNAQMMQMLAQASQARPSDLLSNLPKEFLSNPTLQQQMFAFANMRQ